MTLNMDLVASDISDIHSESDPEDIIKLLYYNALSTISDLLEPHLKAVKKAAGRLRPLGLHEVAVDEDIIESADSIDSLLNRMSVLGMWNKTRFLRKAVESIPQSAPEREVAQAILFHYHRHLENHERATRLKDALARETASEEAMILVEANKQVPVKITLAKAFDSFSCQDCHLLQVHVLSKAYGIPEEQIVRRAAEKRCSITVTFVIPYQFTHNIIQRSAELVTVWILIDMSIIELSIPGVFTFTPSMGCFLTLLRGSKAFTADLLGVTEVRVLHQYL